MDSAYFEALYADNEDPWDFAGSDYERQKYEATLAALPQQQYRSALEVGCSIGVFTGMLAGRCDRLVAIDPIEGALQQARKRCAERTNVEFRRMEVPSQWPAVSFDLIILAEVVYYLTREQIHALAAHIDQTLAPGGDIVLVHWTGETDYPLSGDDAAECLLAATAHCLTVARQQRMPRYRLDVAHRPK